MTSVDMTRLISHAKIRLPGALDAAIQMELFALMNEFFQSTNIWFQDIAFAVTPTSDAYIDNPAAYTYTLTPTLGSISRLVGVIDAAAIPQRAYMPILGSVVLANSPNLATTYTARVSLTVTDPVTVDGYPDFPAWILNKYGNDILEGLLGRMMAQIAKPYSSAQMAMFHTKNFKQAINQARAEALHQNVYRGQNWRFPQTFANSRHQRR
jgi:hypothetical protein